jgi:hypothetical protein
MDQPLSTSLQEWVANNIEQERTNNKITRINIDPLFNSTLLIKQARMHSFFKKVRHLRKQIFLLPNYFSITNDITDLDGNALSSDKSYSLAHISNDIF